MKQNEMKLLEWKRNRSTASDRPENGSQLRKAKFPCETYEFHFQRGDRYGCCKQCGEEVLT